MKYVASSGSNMEEGADIGEANTSINTKLKLWNISLQ